VPVLVVSQITMWLKMGPRNVKMISHVMLTRQAPVPSRILVYQTMTWLEMGQLMAKLTVCMMLAKWAPASVDVLLLTLTQMETAFPIALAILFDQCQDQDKLAPVEIGTMIPMPSKIEHPIATVTAITKILLFFQFVNKEFQIFVI